MKLLNNKSFTLMEMLMVLVIVTLVFYISSINFIKTKENITLINDVQLLAQSYQSLQAKSLELNKESYIQLLNNGFKCYIQNNEVCNYEYDLSYQINSNFTNNQIKINDDGNIVRGGTVNYKYKDFEKALVISIGSGRYEIR